MSIDAMVALPALYANSYRQRVSCNLCNRRMHLALDYTGAHQYNCNISRSNVSRLDVLDNLPAVLQAAACMVMN